MKILRNADKVYITKRLAAIYYTAVHWQDENWEDFVESIIGNCVDIAFRVGGERMMEIDLPACVMEISRKCQKPEEGE